MASGNYSILEAQLPLVGGVAGHDLLVLVDPDGNVIGEIDGLATGSNGQIKPIGYLPSDRLMTYTYSQAMYYSPNEAQVVLSSGSEDEIMSQWNAAVAAANEINQLNLPYPFMGLGSNSNSVASTLINAMGLSEPSMPGGASILPGAGTILLSQAVIQNIQQTYGISSIVGSAGSFLEGVETDNGVTTATVKNADGSYSVSTFSISPSGDGLSTLTGYNAQNVVQFVEINDVSASGQTSVSVSGQGAVVEQNGAAITIAPGSQATLGGANDLINPGGTDTLTLGANSASTTISIDNSGNVTVQDTSSTDGVSTTISLNSTDGSGSLAVGGQSVLNFGAGSSINVDAGSITVSSAPATGWTESAQLSQSGALTQTFDSTTSGGSIALTFSDDPGSISGAAPQLTSATLDGQAIDLSGIYSDIQSNAQTSAQDAATQTGSLLTNDQSAIQTALATGDLSSLPGDPEGWLTGLSSLLQSASTDASVSGSIISDINSNSGDVALVPPASQDADPPSGYDYDPGLPTVPGNWSGTVIIDDGGNTETIAGGDLTSVTVDGATWDSNTLDASGGGGGDDGGDSGADEYADLMQALFGGDSASAMADVEFLEDQGVFIGAGVAGNPYTFASYSDYTPADGVPAAGNIPGIGDPADTSGHDGFGDGGGTDDGGTFVAFNDDGGGDGDGDTSPIVIVVDPLVLSTDGGSINLLSEQESQQTYGTQGFGRPTDTGWVGANTGFLATDVSGTITVIQNFTDLASLDANHDGVINASDPAWATLGVYVYASQDGVANGEYGFVSLSALGIQSINVVSTATNQTVNGNVISATATVTFTNGTTEAIDDVSFEGTTTPQIASQGLSGNSGTALGFYSRVLEYLPAKAEGTAQQVAQTTGSLASWASALPGQDSDYTSTLSRGSLEDVNDISVVGGDTLVYNQADPTYGTVLNLDDAHIYMLTANGSVEYNSAPIYADFNAAANSVAQELTGIGATATAVQAAATAQSNSESAAMAADTSNAAIGSDQDQGAAADAASTEQSWLTAFTYLASTLNSIPDATQVLSTSATDLEQIVLPSGAHYLTEADAQSAAFLLGNQSNLTTALAQGTAAFETLLAAVAQAWDVTKITFAAAGSNVQAAGGDLVLAATGAETLSDGATPSTYVILPGAQVQITNFHAGYNGSRLDFLSPGETVTISEVANGTQIQMGSTSVLLVGVNVSALSYFDNFAGVSAASFSNLNGAEINLASSGSVIEDGTTHIDTLTVTGSSDTLIANDGIDVLSANGASDTLVGGSGADMLNATGSTNTLVAGAGTNELVVSGAGSGNVLIGGTGVDDMLANSGQQTNDTFTGSTGNDVMRVTGNSNTLIAGSGVDALFANGNSNTLVSGSDNDLLEVGTGTGNLLVGGSGSSELVSDASGNTLVGGTGLTQAFYTADSMTVNLAAGTASVNGSGVGDTLINVANVDVVGTDDTLVAGNSAGILWGSGQDDTLIGGSGATTLISNMAGNTLEAGAGGAQVRYSYDGIVIDLATGAVTNVIGGGTSDTLIGVTQAVATGNSDTLIGTASGKDFLAGEGTGNTLIATGTSNTLTGGTASMLVSNNVGSNTLIAGTGAASVGYDASGVAIDLATGIVAEGAASDTLIGTFSVAQANGSDDALIGDSGATTLVSDAAGNTLIAGTGQTQVWYASSSVTVNLDAGTAGVNGASVGDTLTGIAVATVAGNNDTLVALGAGKTLESDGGTNTLVSDAAGNTLISLAGPTVASFGNGVSVNLGTGTAALNGTHDTLVGITLAQATGSDETLVGGSAASTLISDAAGNTLIAGTAQTAADYSDNNLTINLNAGSAGVSGAGTSDTLVGISIAIVAGSGNTLVGGNGDVLINVSGNSDTLIATGSGETLQGGSGNSTLISSAVGNTLQGGSGSTTADFLASGLTINLASNSVTGGGAAGVISGIPDVLINGNENTVLGSSHDVIEANGNANTLIAALGGSDFLEALSGSGNTIVAAGSQNTLEGGAGDTTLVSSAAGNTLIGGLGRTVAEYSGANLTVNLQAGTATVNGLGTSGGDTLIGITAAEVTGLDDTLIGSNGDVLSDSGLGDTLAANGDHDILKAGSGFSTLASNAAGNTLIGALGSTDAFYGGNDVTVNLADGMAEIDGSSTTDTLVGIDIAQAGGTGDTLFGTAGISTLASNGAGNTLIAGTTRTVASYGGSGVTVNLGTGTATVNGTGISDTLLNILAGSVTGANDTLIGSAGGDDFLVATGANDTLVASGNGNTLEGASGSDTLITNSAGNTLVGGVSGTVAFYTGNGLTVNLSGGLVTGVTDVIATGTNDILIAGSGNDTLTAQGAHDILEGGSGVSTLTGNGNGNSLIAGSGLTVAEYGGSGTTINLATQRVSVNGTGGDSLSGITVAEAVGSGQTLVGINDAMSTLVGNARGDTLVGGAIYDATYVNSQTDMETFATLQTVAYYAGNNISATNSSVSVNGSGIADALSGISDIEIVGDDDTFSGNGGILTGDEDTINGWGTLVGSDGTLIGSGYIWGSDNTAVGSGLIARAGNNNVLISAGTRAQLFGGSGTTTLVSNGTGNALYGGTGPTIAAFTSDVYVDLGNQVAEQWPNSYEGWLPGSAQYQGDYLTNITIAQAAGTGDILIAANNDTIGGNGDGNTLISQYYEDTQSPSYDHYAANNEAYFYANNLSINGGDDGLGYADSAQGEDTIVGWFTDYEVSGNNDHMFAIGALDEASGSNDVISGASTMEATGSNDTLIGGNDQSTLLASGYNDTLIAGWVMEAGVGTSVLIGWADGATLVGSTTGIAIASYGSVPDDSVYIPEETSTGTLSTVGLVVNLGNGTVSGGTVSWSEYDYVNGATVLDHSVVANTGVDTLIDISVAQAGGVGETLIGGAGLTTLTSDLQGNTLIAGTGRTVGYFAQNGVYVQLGGAGQSGEASISDDGDASLTGSAKFPGTTQDVLVGIQTVDIVGNNGYAGGSSAGGNLLEATGMDDTLAAQGTGNTLLASGSNETLYGSGSDLMQITGGTGENLLVSGGNSVLEDLGGSGTYDTLMASHNDTLIDQTGSAVLYGNLESNTLIGTGQTEVDYTWQPNEFPGSLVVNLATGIATDGNGDTDTLIGIGSVFSAAGPDTTLIGANTGGSFLWGAGQDTTVIAAGSDNTLEGGRLSTLVSSSIGGNTLIGGAVLRSRNAGVAFYSESFMTVNLATGIASAYGRMNDTLIRINEAEVSGQDETLIGGTGTTTLSTTLASAMVGGSTLIAGTGTTEVLYTGSGDVANLATGVVSSLDSADDTLIGTFVIGGLSGKNDVMVGGTNTETFIGSGSSDTFIGGSGATTFSGNLGGNTMIAGSGLSALDYNVTDGVIDLATDTVEGSAGSDTLIGVFTEAITMSSDNVIIGSLKGGDLLEVQGNDSTVIASGTSNVLDDYETGTATLVSGSVGNNTLIGSVDPTAAEYLLPIGGTVAEYTGANVTVNLGTDRATAGGATDTLLGITIAEAGGAHDILTGPGTLIGGLNSDTLSGGLAEYVAAGVTVNLGTQTATNGTASDTLVGITTALITGTNDILIGSSSGGDTLIGQASGNDTLMGGLHGNTLEDGLAYYSNSNLDISFTLTPVTDYVIGTVTASGAGHADTLVEVTDLELTGNDDTVSSGLAVGEIYADGFGDTLIGNGTIGSDFVSDAAGNTLIAAAGTQLPYEIASYDGNGVTVNLAAGTATVQGASISDKLIGFTSADVGGDHDTLSAGSVANAVLSSSGTNNTLIAGTGGGDQIEDNASGYDYFDVGVGDGAVSLNNGYYGATSATLPTDELDFGSGISDSDLWFSRSGYDLLVNVMGTNTSVDITGWFGGPDGASGDPLAKITAGGLSITSQVSQLVQAMATYSGDNPGFNPVTATQMPASTALQSVIAVSWHA
ncbi:MAG: calcium-binding protein [Pseudomonadota bacterium]